MLIPPFFSSTRPQRSSAVWPLPPVRAFYERREWEAKAVCELPSFASTWMPKSDTYEAFCGMTKYSILTDRFTHIRAPEHI